MKIFSSVTPSKVVLIALGVCVVMSSVALVMVPEHNTKKVIACIFAFIGWILVIGFSQKLTELIELIEKIKSNLLTQQGVDAQLKHFGMILERAEADGTPLCSTVSEEGLAEQLEIGDAYRNYWDTITLAEDLGFKTPKKLTVCMQSSVTPHAA